MTKRKLITIVIIALIVIQFVRIDKNNPPADSNKDFLLASQADAAISDMIRNACYDCHSHETLYPWYAEVAPISWMIQNHIVEGREHLNFSEWTQYDREKQKHKMEECIEMVNSGEMPMKSFTWLHPEARLNDEQKRELSSFFNKMYEAL